MHWYLKTPNPLNYGSASICRLGPVQLFLRQSKTGSFILLQRSYRNFQQDHTVSLAVGVKMLEHLREIWGRGGGFWGAFADGWLWVFAHLSGSAGLLASRDPGTGKGVGGGSEEQLYCQSRTLNPTFLVILITNILLVPLFAWGLDSSSSPCSNEQKWPEKSDRFLSFILKAIFSSYSFCLCYIEKNKTFLAASTGGPQQDGKAL